MTISATTWLTSPRFFPGYSEARERAERMDLAALLQIIDSLYGRDALRYDDGVEEVRAEALRQLEREWTNPEWARAHPEYCPWMR